MRRFIVANDYDFSSITIQNISTFFRPSELLSSFKMQHKTGLHFRRNQSQWEKKGSRKTTPGTTLPTKRSWWNSPNRTALSPASQLWNGPKTARTFIRYCRHVSQDSRTQMLPVQFLNVGMNHDTISIWLYLISLKFFEMLKYFKNLHVSWRTMVWLSLVFNSMAIICKSQRRLNKNWLSDLKLETLT